MKQSISLKDLPAFCEGFSKNLKEPHLVLLNGPLGAGKTQFVKLCVQNLLFAEAVVESPTFSIINEYGGAPPIYHVDLYRLENKADVDSTGFWDLFEGDNAIIFVEWPERVDLKDFPLHWKKTKVDISFSKKEDVRDFTVSVIS